MSSIRTLTVAAVAALASSGLFAESLNVAGGETLTVSSDATYDSVTVSGTLVVSNANLTSSGALALTGGTVRLQSGATLTAAGVNASSAESTIEFSGGRLVTSGQIKADGMKLSILSGAGDAFIDFEFSGWAYIFYTPNGGSISSSGSGALVLSIANGQNVGICQNSANFTLRHSGRSELRGGEFGLFKNNVFSQSGELFVAGGAALNMSGSWLAVGSLTGPGTIISAGQLTLNVDGGSQGCCYSYLQSTTTMIKTGAGVLKAIGTMPASFTVRGGEVRAVPRSEVGYSQFKIKVDGVGAQPGNGMQLNELAFFAGEDDVTAGFAATAFDKSSGYHGEGIFDKKEGTNSNKWWYNYDNAANPSFDNAWVTVTYPERRVVTGYKIKTADSGGVAPKSWRLYGRDEGGEWELLDQRIDEPTVPDSLYSWSPEYAVSCASHPGALECSSLSLTNGTKLASMPGTVLSVASLTDAGAFYSFAAGSSVEIGAGADVLSQGIVSSGAFTKSGSSNLVAYGAAAPESLHVKEGVLTLRAPVASRRWKLAIGAVDGEGGVALGEFAVYDQDGDRLNVIGTVTMAGFDPGSFTSTTSPGAKVYDGLDVGQAWCNLNGLNVNDESTWKWTSFTLAEGAAPVVSYNLRTATYVPGGRPKTWKIYAYDSESGWVAVDSRENASMPGTASTWYNGGKPWLVSSAAAARVAAFPAATPVRVDAGATLDLTDAPSTQVSVVEVDGDAVGYGTIVGGACAASGTVRVTMSSGRLPMATTVLPLRLVDCADVENVAGWTLEVNGVVKAKRHLSVAADGTVTIEPSGLVITFR